MHDWLSWSLVYYLLEWVIRVVMLVVVTNRRHGSPMAWLLVIFFLPVPGLALYLLIGENRLPRRRAGRHARLLEELGAIGRRLEGHPAVVHPELPPDQAPFVTLAERLGSMPIVGGNQITLMTETDDMIDRLVADIDAAQRHVHLLYYIFAADATGRKIADALTRAAERGVTCRVLVDAVGSRPMLKRLGRRMIESGIDLRPALPVNPFRRHFARLDLRNHRKVAVIDGCVAYAGSQNLVDADYGHKDMAWHDMSVRLTGPAVLELQAVFVGDWYFETDEMLLSESVFPDPPMLGPIAVQTLPSGPDYPTENYQRMVVAALYAARRRVIITSPYFIPDAAFMQAIETAVLSGVEVEIILPRRSDQVLVGAASRAFYEDLLRLGVRLHLYDDGLLHAKTMSVDDSLALIGSSNFDIRSFELNFEISLLFYGSDVTAQLRDLQNGYIARSTLLGADEWNSRPGRIRVLENIAKLLGPLL
ncbi:MAG TPA: cardiolipin synthase [Thermoguttaceae bacterium]|nr:cardiolipin synthase [Thermoguttaceae bacterium]